MVRFEQLFGVQKEKIKKSCVITPFLSDDLAQSFELTEFSRGSPFSCGQSKDLSLIHTPIGAPFSGDAVLYLADTPCENLIFLGACSLVNQDNGLRLGALVVPDSAVNCESFSNLLTGQINRAPLCTANPHLLTTLCEIENTITKVKCASFGSFKLEEMYRDFLQQNNVQTVDMEVCAFYQAANHIRRRGVGLLYVTEIMGVNHAFEPLTPAQQSLIRISQHKCVQIIRQLALNL